MNTEQIRYADLEPSKESYFNKKNLIINSEISSLEEDLNAEIYASEKVEKWLNITHDFQCIKEALETYKNILIDYIFNKIGYKYKGYFKDPNFLHLSAEAWILGIFQELEKELNEENLKNLKFNKLINYISHIIVKENVFIENIKFLIKKFSYLEAFLKEDKVLRNVLIELNSNKNEILKDEEYSKNEDLTFIEFTKILEKILKMSFAVYINNISSKEENKNNALLYTIYEKLNNENKLTLEDFENTYAKEKNLEDPLSENLRHQLQGYYDFALIKFEHIVSEIILFNKDSSCIFNKMFSMVNNISIADFFLKNVENFSKNHFGNHIDFKKIENFRINRFKDILKNYYTISKDSIQEVKNNVNLKFSNARNWIFSNEIIKNTKIYSNEFYNKSSKFFDLKINWAEKFDYFYSPFKTVTLEMKENGTSYVFTLKDKSIEAVLFFQKFIFGFVANNYQALKSILTGENQFLKVQKKENEGYYSIEINKKLLQVNPKIFNEFFGLVKGLLGKVYNLKFIFDKSNNSENIKELKEPRNDKEDLKSG